MSRIGSKPVAIPSDVTVEVKNKVVIVKGSKGQLQYDLLPEVDAKVEENILRLTRQDNSSPAKARQGLARSLLANMIKGVSDGHQRSVEIIGVGYKAQPKGKILVLSLGYSHTIDFALPEGIEVTQDEKNKNLLTIKGIDKALVGQVAADMRSLRPPEPYKGKGIRYTDEFVRRKPGKAAAAKGAAA